MLSGIIESFLFGITIGIVIGPIAVLIIQKSLVVGLKPAISSGFGAALADLVYALLAFFASEGLVEFLTGHKAMITVISAWILILFGLFIFASSFKKPTGLDSSDTDSLAATKQHFFPVFLLTLSNPLTILFFGGFAGQIIEQVRWQEAVVYSLAIFMGSLLSQSVLAVAGYWFGHALKRWNIAFYCNLLGGCVIAGFGLCQLIK